MYVSEELQTVVKKDTHTFSRFLQTPKYHTKHFLKFSVFVTFSFHDMTLRNILKTSEDQVIKPSVVIRFDVVYPRISLKPSQLFHKKNVFVLSQSTIPVVTLLLSRDDINM